MSNIMYEKLIKDEKLKFKKYDKYLPNDFFEQIFEKYCSENEKVVALNFSLYAKNQMYLEFSRILNDKVENIDDDLKLELLEILVDENNSFLSIWLRKLGVSELDKDDALLKALDSYDGIKQFSAHLLNVIKQIKNGTYEKKKEEPKEEVATNIEILNESKTVKKKKEKNIKKSKKERKQEIVNNIAHEEDKVEQKDVIVTDESKSDSISLDDKIDAYIENHSVQNEKLSYIDSLVLSMNLFEKVEEEKIKTYIYLKYGYYKGYTFNNKEISEILNEPLSAIIQIELKVFELLKIEISERVDLLISFDDSVFEKNYIYKNES